jgi:hypothetical protein
MNNRLNRSKRKFAEIEKPGGDLLATGLFFWGNSS